MTHFLIGEPEAWVRRTGSPYPVRLRFGPPDIKPRSHMPARPPLRCSLRKWLLPHASSRQPISGTRPCLASVALPSGNGERFTSSSPARRSVSASCQAHTEKRRELLPALFLYGLMVRYMSSFHHRGDKAATVAAVVAATTILFLFYKVHIAKGGIHMMGNQQK